MQETPLIITDIKRIFENVKAAAQHVPPGDKLIEREQWENFLVDMDELIQEYSDEEWDVGDCFRCADCGLRMIINNFDQHGVIDQDGHITLYGASSPEEVAGHFKNPKRVSRREFLTGETE